MTEASAVIRTEAVLSAGEVSVLELLMASIRNDEQVTFLLGSGVGADGAPRVANVLRLADQYAAGRSDDGGLRRALVQAREEVDEKPPIDVYASYRRVFADWVSGSEFDVIAQQAVLAAYRPPERMASPLATHGIWQRVELPLGERVENDKGSWLLPEGVEALGAILARMPDTFGNRALTTNFDPLVEIAIRTANGRAASLPLDSNGGYGTTSDEDGAVRVFHLHGFWRPTLQMDHPPLLPDPSRLIDRSQRLVGSTAQLITGDVIFALGCGDWAATLSDALAAVARVRPVRVVWSMHREDAADALRLAERLSTQIGVPVECYPGVDSDRLLPALARRVGVSITPRTAGPRHRVRHHTWERQLISQPDAKPPPEIPALLRQLERRFDWGMHQATSGTPSLLLWPVRLRSRASVIHMVQAFAAGALADRGLKLTICLDDFGVPNNRDSDAFKADLERWVRHTGIGVRPTFVSLTEFIDAQGSRQGYGSARASLRPTDPWAVARAFYGEHNPSLYSVLAAVKAVPNMAINELEENAWPIVQALLSRDANRILTPLTLWSYLNHVLLEDATSSVMTLGGRDEALFWEQWRETFGFGVSQLYNSYIKSLSHESEMLRWSAVDDLRASMRRTRAVAGWDTEGSYISWLFQNALLLPTYLRHQPVPEVGGFPIDSWAAFMAASEVDHVPVLDMLAERVSELYLGENRP